MKIQLSSFDLESYNYKLPPHCIAKFPLEKRQEAKMLVFHRKNQKIEHRKVIHILDYLDNKTLFVANNTKVFPARLTGRRKTGAYLELLLIKEITPNTWECKLWNSRKVKIGEEFVLANGQIQAKLLLKNNNGVCQIAFFCSQDFFTLLQQVGEAPLPPYILKQRANKELQTKDKQKYQTVYAKKYGSIAAPTAGLHFSPELLTKIQEKCSSSFVTLHIGLGTFAPVTSKNIRDHKVHKEYYEIDKKTLKELQLAKKEQKKNLAIGTTSTRVLESLGTKLTTAPSKPIIANTDLFIYPPYSFQNVDHLLTNFHLPKSSLMMLVAAFCKLEILQELYKIAIKEHYRFYSYGDCMLIL